MTFDDVGDGVLAAAEVADDARGPGTAAPPRGVSGAPEAGLREDFAPRSFHIGARCADAQGTVNVVARLVHPV